MSNSLSLIMQTLIACIIFSDLHFCKEMRLFTALSVTGLLSEEFYYE